MICKNFDGLDCECRWCLSGGSSENFKEKICYKEPSKKISSTENKIEKYNFIILDSVNQLGELSNFINEGNYSKDFLLSWIEPIENRLNRSLHGELDKVYSELKELYSEPKDILFLLDKTTIKSFKEYQLNFPLSYWINLSNNSNSNRYITCDGMLGGYCNVELDFAVRPIFKAEILKENFRKERISLGKFCGKDMIWVLSEDKSLYILENYIVSSVFDFNSNDYEKSEIRKVVKEIEKEIVKDMEEKEWNM